MINNIDQRTIRNLRKLIREILTDEAKFEAGDNSLQTIHEHLFSVANRSHYQDYSKTDKLFLRKYFYYGNDANTPRPDVPFSESVVEQEMFFDQFSQLLSLSTYRYSRMDLIRPSLNEENGGEAVFNAFQERTVDHHLLYPLLASIEKGAIKKVEKTSSAQEVKKVQNPFGGLGEKVLVKSKDGTYSTVLTYDQISFLVEQEQMLRNQGLEGEKLYQELQKYINERFPGLDLALTPEGKVELFWNGGLDGENAMSFNQVLRHLKNHQINKIQYDCAIASKGTLSFSGDLYQVIEDSGAVTTVDGNIVHISQGGFGKTGYSFLKDKNGYSAKISFELRQNDDRKNLNFKIYIDPAEDSLSNPSFALSEEQLNLLKQNLLDILAELRKQENPKIVTSLRPIIGKPEANKHDNGENLSSSRGNDSPINLPINTKVLLPIVPSTVTLPEETFNIQRPIKPKISLTHHNRTKTSAGTYKKFKTENEAKTPAQKSKQKTSSRPNQQKQQANSAGSGEQSQELERPVNARSKAWIPWFAAGAPIAGATGASLLKVLGII